MNSVDKQHLHDASESTAKVYALLAVGLLALLLILIAVSPHHTLYDERYYMQSSHLLAETGSFGILMQTRTDIAAGPLYPYLHVVASPLTGLSTPAIRYVNFTCLLTSLAAIAWTLRLMGYEKPWYRAAMLLAVPMMWPTSGLALTELPALALACLAVALAAEGIVTDKAPRRLLAFALSGLFAGLAVTGRQTYLPGLAGYLLLALGERRLRLPVLLALAAASLALAPMLLAWGGLTPPWQSQLRQGLVPEYGVLSYIYLATAIALIAPGFFRPIFVSPRQRWFLVGAVGAAVLTCAATGFRIAVASRVVDKLPLGVQSIAQLGATVIMVALAAAFVIAGLANVVNLRRERVFLLFALLALALAGTAIAVSHQFSSRYVLAAFPFALLGVQRWWQLDRWAVARLGLGSALGMFSLTSYYWNEPPPDSKISPASSAASQSEFDAVRARPTIYATTASAS